MAFKPLEEPLRILKGLSPASIKRLGKRRLSDIVLREIPKAKKRVSELERTYPSAQTRELSQRLIDSRKGVAGMVGGISGVFGMVSLPADLMVMAWLQLVLLVDLATVYKVNLKADLAREELFDIFNYANGLGHVTRAGPKVLGKVVGSLLEKSGLELLGRAMPLVAAPVTAYLNNQSIQAVGDEALRRYEGFDKARGKGEAMSDYAPHTDLLTGAWDRDKFQAEFAKVVSEAQRRREPLALVHIDVDNMQALNDLHGKDVMDGRLVWLAEKVSGVVDGEGPIGRIGGDELGVYMRQCTLEHALKLAERIRRLVPMTLHASAFGDFRLTVSVGVAVNKRGEPWGNLLEAAELACMRAKQGGRDLVVAR